MGERVLALGERDYVGRVSGGGEVENVIPQGGPGAERKILYVMGGVTKLMVA